MPPLHSWRPVYHAFLGGPELAWELLGFWDRRYTAPLFLPPLRVSVALKFRATTLFFNPLL